MIGKYSIHLAFAASLAAAPQEAPEVVTRQLWDATLIEQRPAAKPTSGTKKATPAIMPLRQLAEYPYPGRHLGSAIY